MLFQLGGHALGQNGDGAHQCRYNDDCYCEQIMQKTILNSQFEISGIVISYG